MNIKMNTQELNLNLWISVLKLIALKASDLKPKNLWETFLKDRFNTLIKIEI